MKLLSLLRLILTGLLVAACTLKTPLEFARNNEEDYGMGGTGIVGSVTGFGSIFVNGVEVETNESSEITEDGKSVDDYRFEIGKTVEIETTTGNDYTYARRLNIHRSKLSSFIFQSPHHTSSNPGETDG